MVHRTAEERAFPFRGASRRKRTSHATDTKWAWLTRTRRRARESNGPRCKRRPCGSADWFRAVVPRRDLLASRASFLFRDRSARCVGGCGSTVENPTLPPRFEETTLFFPFILQLLRSLARVAEHLFLCKIPRAILIQFAVATAGSTL